MTTEPTEKATASNAPLSGVIAAPRAPVSAGAEEIRVTAARVLIFAILAWGSVGRRNDW